METIKNEIYERIVSLHSEGYSHFLCGINKDSATFVQAVLQLKKQHADVMLLCVITKDIYSTLSDEQKQPYQSLMYDADGVINTSLQYFNNAFTQPNSYFTGECAMVTVGADALCYAYKESLALMQVFDDSNANSPLNK